MCESQAQSGTGGDEHMQTGTQLLGRAEAEACPPPGTADGTLLAVVPIPGTGTSLAIVGYPVTTQGAATDGGAAAEPVRAPGGLVLDHDQRRVWIDGAEVPMTFQEFQLLAFLSAHPVTVFSRADLVRRVWQRDVHADSRTVDVHVSRLRHKLGPLYGKCLVTEYRVGYQFRPPDPSPAGRPQPLTSGPALVTVTSSRTRLSRSMAAR